MKSNRLSRNCDKTELLWCASSRRQHQLPNRALSIDGTLVEPVTSARDLGIYVDSDLLARIHVQRTVSRCFAVLRQLRQIRRSVPTDTFQTLVVSLVLTRLDYGNSVLAGLPVYLVRRLQSVLNAAARLTYHLRRSDHITDALVCLHWLRVPERVQYKIAVLVYPKFCTDSHCNILVHSTMSPTCLAADLSVLLAPTVWQCLQSSWQPSPTNRAFPVVGPRTWNDLPDDVTSAESLSTFRQWLKTHLFTISFFLIIP